MQYIEVRYIGFSLYFQRFGLGAKLKHENSLS